ncbi:D-sedoheptulose-7-phosphate isomerase [Roseateles violae]|uniref:SIS domain-containing protein n=1 Tax=Roseateles violae TaxID=3058042 RepID=A0ABT8DVU7_9BURK|nr:SIS domain-containing protein [Pelomonas sp. PFR6]MDN3922342.1 SIS domain-containing protein [Pelomonas sp. PFR6]
MMNTVIDPIARGHLDPLALFTHNLAQHRRLFEALDELAAPIAAAAARMTDTLARGGRLFFFGNGGSAADSQHLAAELSGRLRRERRPLAALALSADTAVLTAIANDYGYEQLFARQLAALARRGDCAIGISTSGASPNVLRAFEAARALGVHTVGLLGRDGGAALQRCEQAVVIAHHDSARIQEAHIFVGHTWCEQIEIGLGLAG